MEDCVSVYLCLGTEISGKRGIRLNSRQHWAVELGERKSVSISTLYISMCFDSLKTTLLGGKKTPLSRKGVKEIPDLCEASLEQCREALKQALGSSYWMRNWPAFRDKLPSIGDLTKPEEWRENHIILQKVWGEWKAKEFLREVILSMNLKEEVKFCWLKRRKKVSRRV